MNRRVGLRRRGLSRSVGLTRLTGLRPRSGKQAQRDKAWGVRKYEVYERDGFRCQRCGISGFSTLLDPHHLLPRGRGGTDELSNLVTLCRHCHQLVHCWPQKAYEQRWLRRSGEGAA